MVVSCSGSTITITATLFAIYDFMLFYEFYLCLKLHAENQARVEFFP
jgi:hypothetical protein